VGGACGGVCGGWCVCVCGGGVIRRTKNNVCVVS